MKAERGEKAAEQSLVTRDWFMMFKKRIHLYDVIVQHEARCVDVKAAASYPEELDKIINEGNCTKQVFNVMEQLYIRIRSALGLSQLE